MDTSQTVAEYLLGQEATVENIADALKRDIRTVYRALESLKKNKDFRVMRWGEHGAYVYKIERVARLEDTA